MNGGNVCRFHGGKTPRGENSPHYKHGRYSKYLSAQLREKLSTDDDPFSLADELSVQRVLFADYLQRFEAGNRLTAQDIQYMMSWADGIGKMVERIQKIRNDSALTAIEMKFLAARTAEIVVKYIDDPERQSAFVSDLFAGLRERDTAKLSTGE